MQEELKSKPETESEESAVVQDEEPGRDDMEPGSLNGGADETALASPEEEKQSEEDELTAEKYEELQDKYYRALAEVENIRRISDRDRQEAGKFGASKLARDLLPVHDCLKMALNSVDDVQRETSRALIEGIELTLKELLNAVGRHGVKLVSPEKGDRFDPKLHQAMFEAPSQDIEAGNIMEIMAEGFTMHERLLRPAQVGVSSGSPAGEVLVEQDSTAG